MYMCINAIYIYFKNIKHVGRPYIYIYGIYTHIHVINVGNRKLLWILKWGDLIKSYMRKIILVMIRGKTQMREISEH